MRNKRKYDPELKARIEKLERMLKEVMMLVKEGK